MSLETLTLKELIKLTYKYKSKHTKIYYKLINEQTNRLISYKRIVENSIKYLFYFHQNRGKRICHCII